VATKTQARRACRPALVMGIVHGGRSRQLSRTWSQDERDDRMTDMNLPRILIDSGWLGGR
jgi:hypothetical protein